MFHGVLGGGHELGGEAELAVGAEDGEGGDVAVALGGLLLHLGEDVADDAAVVVLGDVEELRPREDVVEVVLHLVVLWQAEQVARLHRQQVIHRGLPYAHHTHSLHFAPHTQRTGFGLVWFGIESWGVRVPTKRRGAVEWGNDFA